MSNILDKRVEMVFLYDVRDANPNGDPDDGNRPRIDEVTGENIVTDVRLKRTIRDFWTSQGKEILVKAVEKKDGTRETMEDRVLGFLQIKKVEPKKRGEVKIKLNNELPKKFIDTRSFGAAITLSGANTSLTGPVQFGLGRSLNKPLVQSKTITTTLASGEGKSQGTIGEYHTIDYSLIRFHGIINEVNARKLGFSEDDVKSLQEAIWKGTEMLNTRSKFNHKPRLLITVFYKDGFSQIGDLDLGFSLKSIENLKSIDDAKLEAGELIKMLSHHKDSIEKIQIQYDDKLGMADEADLIANLNGTQITIERI